VCWVKVRLGRVCILNFQEESTELPGCELSLSRCRRSGGVFRAGWSVNQASVYVIGVGPRVVRGCSLGVSGERGRVHGAIDARN
jgi:hypothetical protein